MQGRLGIKIAVTMRQIEDKLKAVTEEVEKAITRLESQAKGGGGTKKKAKKHQVEIRYDVFTSNGECICSDYSWIIY